MGHKKMAASALPTVHARKDKRPSQYNSRYLQKARARGSQSGHRGTITAEIEVCGKKLTELQKLAPEMWRQHLKQRVKAARKVGDDEKAEVILKMLTKEAQKKRWQRVNYS